MVNPIAARKEMPNSIEVLIPFGILYQPSLIPNIDNPKIPISFPKNNPKPTPRATGLLIISNQSLSITTPALARAKIGITK